MLQDMSNTSGILWHGLKGKAEGLIRIGIFYCQGWGSEYLMLKEIDFRMNISNMLFSSQKKSMINGTRGEICHTRPFRVEFDGNRMKPEKRNSDGGIFLKFLVRIKKNSNWTRINQTDIHHGLKFSGGSGDTGVGNHLNKLLVHLPSLVRRGCL